MTLGSESRCGMSGRACLRASSSTWEAVSVGPLVPVTWSHRGWDFMSLVEEVNPLILGWSEVSK